MTTTTVIQNGQQTLQVDISGNPNGNYLDEIATTCNAVVSNATCVATQSSRYLCSLFKSTSTNVDITNCNNPSNSTTLYDCANDALSSNTHCSKDDENSLYGNLTLGLIVGGSILGLLIAAVLYRKYRREQPAIELQSINVGNPDSDANNSGYGSIRP